MAISANILLLISCYSECGMFINILINQERSASDMKTLILISDCDKRCPSHHFPPLFIGFAWTQPSRPDKRWLWTGPISPWRKPLRVQLSEVCGAPLVYVQGPTPHLASPSPNPIDRHLTSPTPVPLPSSTGLPFLACRHGLDSPCVPHLSVFDVRGDADWAAPSPGAVLIGQGPAWHRDQAAPNKGLFNFLFYLKNPTFLLFVLPFLVPRGIS